MSFVPNDGDAVVSVSTGSGNPAKSTARLRGQQSSSAKEKEAEISAPSTPGENENGFRFHSVWESAELDRLVGSEDADLETYEVTELRDGFFDALFLKPRPVQQDQDALLRRAERTLPYSFREGHPWSVRSFLPKQWHELKGVVRRVATTRSGVRLAKSFIAFFVAFALCLVPSIRSWLGPHSYILAISTIINHPARTVGSQLDGTVSTILGTVTGLLWGAFGLWLSTSTVESRVGYGAILATFLLVYIIGIAAMRAYFIRLYQFVIAAGLAVTYTCLADVSREAVPWEKLFEYAKLWALGQAICLVTCIVWFPDAGARNLAVCLNDAFGVMMDGLDIRKAQNQRTRRRLAQTFINLSQAYRDLTIDITLSLFGPKDVLALRNSLQGVVRSLLAMRAEPATYGRHIPEETDSPHLAASLPALIQTTILATPGLSEVNPDRMLRLAHLKRQAVHLVRSRLDEPTKALLHRMKSALQTCHAVLMDMSGYRRYLGPGEEIESNVSAALVELRHVMVEFDEADAALLEGEDLAAEFVAEVVEVFAYCRSVRQVATSIEVVLIQVNGMEQRKPKFPRLYLPSYPWKKALGRTNPQVRHDRGGVTATSFYRNFGEIAQLIQEIKSTEHTSLPHEPELFRTGTGQSASVYSMGDPDDYRLEKSAVRYNIWKVLHRLQGFEMRFAFKTAVIISLLSIPAWLNTSREWWNDFEAWWAVAMAWLMMHPRVGGNLQDLVTRALLGALGAVWAGAGHAAGSGNPFVMGAFAMIYMVPMLYRFTQSSHARSGLVGCVSFTVTSLTLMNDHPRTTPLVTAISRGVAFVVGVVAAVLINWIIWPFVARHELRKALSMMMFFLSIVYRSIVAKYVYYDLGEAPTVQDIERSEILEGRIREGFVRIRQLMGLTRHEIRLRAPFDVLPYSALADSCERFFEFLVAVRQSALYFHPKFARDNDEAIARLLIYRRDAVAAVLTNLYILAGALRADRRVPKYLPSAAAARKRLVDKMAELEAEYEEDKYRLQPQLTARKKWMQIYSYSYSESLTGCVTQLEELERYTKLIVGEHGFDDEFEDTDTDEI